MDVIITEKNYPIRNIWLFKQVFVVIIILPIYFFFFIFSTNSGSVSSKVPEALILILPIILVFGLVLAIPFIIKVLQRSNFHYSLEDHYIALHQGVISKQNRNVPYGRIQGVFVNQNLFDRVFGLASLTFEDYSDGGISVMSADGYIGSGKSRHEALGFVGNKIHIPGLKKDDAETLKAIILQKIKENPIEDNQSGL